MAQEFWKRIWGKKAKKNYLAWQIELTSRCPLQCRMCNRITYRDFPRQDMAFSDFQKLLPYLKEVETVILEGWGESLLYKNLPECIRLVKKEGPRVGFVTSGKGLNEVYLKELLSSGVDFLGFSLAGTKAQTHEAIRVNSSFAELMANILLLQEMKKNRQILTPHLHIVYLMVRDNIQQVPDLVSLAQELSISEIILINLIHVTNSWQEEQKVFGPTAQAEYQKLIAEAQARAVPKKIKIHCPSLSFQEVGLCAENPLRNLYISMNGEVSPCVYLNPPLPSPFKRIFKGQEFLIPRVYFGNIFNEPIARIWSNKEYQDFRSSWAHRQKASLQAASFLWNLDYYKNLAYPPLPPPPVPCQTCYKTLGV